MIIFAFAFTYIHIYLSAFFPVLPTSPVTSLLLSLHHNEDIDNSFCGVVRVRGGGGALWREVQVVG